MELLWKTIAGTLLATILGLAVQKKEKDLAVLLSIAACCMGAVTIFTYLEPVLIFLQNLELPWNTQENILSILLKGTGIGLVTEIASLICTDAGNSSFGRIMQLLGSTAILYLSLPIFTAMLNLIQQILGEL